MLRQVVFSGLAALGVLRGDAPAPTAVNPLLELSRAFRDSYVVPQVLPRFDPIGLLGITLDGPAHKAVRAGQHVGKAAVASVPVFDYLSLWPVLTTPADALYTLLCAALDRSRLDSAVSSTRTLRRRAIRACPTVRLGPATLADGAVLHYLAIDLTIDDSTALIGGKVLGKWIAPSPPQGMHRCAGAVLARRADGTATSPCSIASSARSRFRRRSGTWRTKPRVRARTSICRPSCATARWPIRSAAIVRRARRRPADRAVFNVSASHAAFAPWR